MIPTNTDLRPRKQKAWDKPWFLPVVGGAICLLVGMGIGATGKPAPEIQQVPGPERVVTKQVEVTPAVCLKALDLSEEGFGMAAEAMGYMSDALTAASKFDVASMQSANSSLDTLNPKMHALAAPMKSAVAECRAAK